MLLNGGDTKECFFAGCADFECHSKILLLLRPQKLQKQKIVMATQISRSRDPDNYCDDIPSTVTMMIAYI